MRLKVLTLSALVAAATALWGALPAVISRLVKLEPKNPRPGLTRLKLGHAMAGGLTDAPAADEAMANALKAVMTSKVAGARAAARLAGVHTEARDAWRTLLTTLLDAESSYLSPTMGFGLGPRDHAENEIAEGLRYLTHVTRLSMELYVEDGPRFVRFVSPQLKLLGDNPDALYFIARIEPPREYIITGCRTRELYYSLSVHAKAEGGAFPRVASDINDSNIRLDAVRRTESLNPRDRAARARLRFPAAHACAPLANGRMAVPASHTPSRAVTRA